MCVCVCKRESEVEGWRERVCIMCVCLREREREREGWREGSNTKPMFLCKY